MMCVSVGAEGGRAKCILDDAVEVKWVSCELAVES